MGYDVAITRCEDYGDKTLSTAIARAVDAAGGLDWVRPGMRIAIKANLMMAKAPRHAATVEPRFLAAVCELFTSRGASVVIGDSPGGPFIASYLKHIYDATGVSALENGAVKLNDNFGFCNVESGGNTLDSFPATSYLLDADAIVDVCKLKTHGLMGYTGACKNFYGGVAGMVKSEFHYRFSTAERFADMLVDLCEFFKPRLSICDAVVAMEGNGPSAGKPRALCAVLAAQNPHALDLAGASLIGLSVADVPTLTAAVRRGLVPDDLSQLNIFGDLSGFGVADFELCEKRDVRMWGTKSKLLSSLLQGMFARRPKVDKARCAGCGECAKVCPAGAISVSSGKASINRKKCIGCFCCQEFCPVGAISVRRALVARLLTRRVTK